jgi:hypothetical protein
MISGIYSAVFASNNNVVGSGVAVFSGNALHGDDRAYYYKAKYKLNESNKIAALVEASQTYIRRRMFILLLGAYIVLGAVLPASADWQFTKWGMSPKQVVEASHGQALPLSRDKQVESRIEGLDALLKQDWQSGRFLFTVVYFFQKAGGGLTLVNLTLRNNELSYDLEGALHTKYGAPDSEIKEANVDIETVIWRT